MLQFPLQTVRWRGFIICSGRRMIKLIPIVFYQPGRFVKKKQFCKGGLDCWTRKCDLTATFYGKTDLMKWKAALQE